MLIKSLLDHFQRHLMVTALALLLAACSSGVPTDNDPADDVPKDTISPKVTIPPAASRLIEKSVITITFSESMDTTQFKLGGSLAAESDGGTWSSINVQHDTLTIRPAYRWSAASGHDLIVDAQDLAGNAVDTMTLTYEVDDTANPTATIAPVAYLINGNSPITIFFSESMDTGSLVLGGSLASESDGGTWSSINVQHDTLTIRPASSWSDNTSHRLLVDAKDLVGKAVAQITLNYAIDAIKPLGSIQPVESQINQHAVITIIFNERMDTGSLVLRGSLAPESNGGVWSSTNLKNDTLTIHPAYRWSAESDHSLIVSTQDLAGNVVATNVTYDVEDTTVPSVTVNPFGRFLNEDGVITITFNESMDITEGNWRISGTLASESDGGVWSKAFESNDTLTISPKPAHHWETDTERTLTIEAQDLAGHPIATTNLIYDVYSGRLYYVNASRPNDRGNGLTPATALKSIPSAITLARAPATLLVSEGDYLVDSAQDTHVVLRTGVSLYGGYDQNFREREPATYISRIRDESTAAGTSDLPNRAIEGDGDNLRIYRSSIVDGFTIEGSTQAETEYNAAIFLINNASPTIRNNSIHGGGGNVSYGIYNNSSSPAVETNTIHGGRGNSESYGLNNVDESSPRVTSNTIDGGSGGGSSYGMYNINSSPNVWNNTIYGGSGANGSYGMHITYDPGAVSTDRFTSSLNVRNNSINGGSGVTSVHGILITYDPSAVPSEDFTFSLRVDNNILMTRTGPGSYCYHDIMLVSLRNNDFAGCEVMVWDDGGGCSSDGDGDSDSRTCALAEINTVEGISGNIAVDPQFVDIDGADNNINTMADNDWHLSDSSPLDVTAGGLNGVDEGWSFDTDKDGVIRPESKSPWSIGAYVFNGQP